jgi:hypothetical protein
VDARLRRLHGVELIVDRRGGTGEVVDLVDLERQRHRDVVRISLEDRVRAAGAATFARVPREEVVEAQHFVSLGEQSLAEMRADEARAAGDEHALARRAAPIAPG